MVPVSWTKTMANMVYVLSTWLLTIKEVLLLLCNVTFTSLLHVIRSLLPSYKSQITMEPLPPGNMGWPIIGETIDFLRKSQNGEFFKERYAKYGPIFRTNFLGMNNIHIREVSHVKKILLGEHHLVATCWPPAMRRLLGKGALATMLDPDHRQLRRYMRPLLSAEAFTASKAVMVRCIGNELLEWKRQPVMDLYSAAKHLTLKCGCAVLIGEDGLDDHMISEMSTNFITFGDGFFQLPLMIPGSKYYQAVQAKRSILQEIEKLCKANSSTPSVINQIYGAPDDGVLRTQTEKNNLAVELLFGAQETAACTITCAITLLEQNPHVLKKLSDEIDEFYGEVMKHSDDAVSWMLSRDVRVLTYLTNVIKETLRLFPPIGGGFRKILRPFVLGEYWIPKDWTITYSIQCMHDESDMDNVTEFIPERWDSIRQGSYVSSFLPFGAGPRSCVGRDYAYQFIGLALAMLIGTCRWQLHTKAPTFTRVPIVKPEQPIMVKMMDIDGK